MKNFANVKGKLRKKTSNIFRKANALEAFFSNVFGLYPTNSLKQDSITDSITDLQDTSEYLFYKTLVNGCEINLVSHNLFS